MQRALDLGTGLPIGELQGGHVLEDGLHEARLAHQAEAMARERTAVVREPHLEGLDAEDATLGIHRPGDLDLAADKRIEERAWRAEGFRPEGEVTEELLQRRLAGQAHGANTALAIDDGEALEKFGDLIEAHGQIDA